MPLFALEGREPAVSPAAWIAPTATLIGDVQVEAEASIWYGAVLRADFGSIIVRRGANVQDGSILHGGSDPVTEVGEGATIGHLCVVPGAIVHAEALVGNGATVLDGVIVGRRALVAAGCTVPPGMTIPAGMLAVGVPARIAGEVTGAAKEWVDTNPAVYRELARRHAAGIRPVAAPAASDIGAARARRIRAAKGEAAGMRLASSRCRKPARCAATCSEPCGHGSRAARSRQPDGARRRRAAVRNLAAAAPGTSLPGTAREGHERTGAQLGLTRDHAGVIDVVGGDQGAVVAADQRVKVPHHAIAPDEGPAVALRVTRGADHLTAAVDAQRLAGGVPRQDAEPADAAMPGPEESLDSEAAAGCRGDVGEADYLAALVEGHRRVPCHAAESSDADTATPRA
jgi:carbonic anhydrase/acetyltransferase-like protein (isoleucine patch superfamily)